MASVVDPLVGALGILPTTLAAMANARWLALALLLATTTALLVPSTVYAIDDDGRRPTGVRAAQLTADAVARALLALACALALRLHATLVGALRTLWLVSVVTASSTYAYFRTLLRNDALPGDANVVAVVATALVLLALFACSKCRGQLQTRSSRLAVAAEIVLVTGAVALRFDEDFVAYTGVHVGVLGWRGLSWAASALTVAKVWSGASEADVE